jgi:hypothetical protein
MSNQTRILYGREADAHWQSLQNAGAMTLTQEINRLIAN